MFDDVVVHVDENPEEKATKGREDKSMGGAQKVLQGRHNAIYCSFNRSVTKATDCKVSSRRCYLLHQKGK